MDLFDLASSQRLKFKGMERAAYSSQDTSEWLLRARGVAEMLAAKNGSVTSNDVLRAFPRPEHIHPNATGSIFKEKKWVCVGRVNSDKISAHAREIKVWELKNT